MKLRNGKCTICPPARSGHVVQQPRLSTQPQIGSEHYEASLLLTAYAAIVISSTVYSILACYMNIDITAFSLANFTTL